MLFAKLLRSPHPHARRSVDASRAAALPGVSRAHARIADPFGILPVSQDEHAMALDKVRFVAIRWPPSAATTEEAPRRPGPDHRDYEMLRAFPDALAPSRIPSRRSTTTPIGNIHKLIVSSSERRGGLAQPTSCARTVLLRGDTTADGAARAVADCSPRPDGAHV